MPDKFALPTLMSSLISAIHFVAVLMLIWLEPIDTLLAHASVLFLITLRHRNAVSIRRPPLQPRTAPPSFPLLTTLLLLLVVRPLDLTVRLPAQLMCSSVVV